MLEMEGVLIVVKKLSFHMHIGISSGTSADTAQVKMPTMKLKH